MWQNLPCTYRGFSTIGGIGMINRNTMLIENHRFWTELRGNKGRYLDFLGTMADYPKDNLMQQATL